MESTVKNGKKSVKKAETIDNMDVIEAEGAVAEDTAVEVLRRRKRTSEPHRPQYYRHPAYRKRFNNYYYSNPSFYHGHPPQKRPFVKFAKKDGTNDESIPVAEAETTVEKMTPEKGHEHQKVFYKKKPFGYVPYQHYPVHYPYYHYTLPAGAPLQELGSDEKMMEPMTEEEDSSAAGEMGEVESEDVMEKAEVDEKNASESDSEAEVEAAAPEAEAEAEAEAVPEAEAEAESTPAEEGEKADNEAEEGETSEEEAEMMGEAENDPMTLLGAPGLRQQLLVPPPRYYPYYHHRPHVYYAAPHKHTALKVGGAEKQYQHAPQPYGQFPFYHHQPHAFRYVRYGVDPMEEAAVEAEEGAAGMVELEGMVPISPEADQDGALTQ